MHWTPHYDERALRAELTAIFSCLTPEGTRELLELLRAMCTDPSESRMRRDLGDRWPSERQFYGTTPSAEARAKYLPMRDEWLMQGCVSVR